MDKLLSYLPWLYHKNEEMLALTGAEQPEVDALWDAIMRVRLNQYITTADVFRIRQWERLLRIRPDTSVQSLQQRKEIILLRLQTRPPFTKVWLRQFVEELFGPENVSIQQNFGAHTLFIYAIYNDVVVLNELRILLRHIIPVVLGFGLRQIVPQVVNPTPVALATACAHSVTHLHHAMPRNLNHHHEMAPTPIIPVATCAHTVTHLHQAVKSTYIENMLLLEIDGILYQGFVEVDGNVSPGFLEIIEEGD